jgi:Legume lectin domain
MMRKSTYCCGLTLACLSILTLMPVLAHAQAFNIAPGGFTNSNVCASASPTPNCQVQTNGSPNLPQVLPSGALRLNTADSNQHASAWFFTQQPLSTGFTTAFQFQMSNTNHCNGCGFPADGIALVIQGDAAGTGALGFTGDGQDIAYGNNNTPGATGPGAAIQNSLAIELDSFFNPSYGDPDGNHIAVQSCASSEALGLNSNSADHGYICPNGVAAKIALQSLPSGLSLSDGNPHTITVNYLPPANGCVSGCNNLSVFSDSSLILQTTVDLTQYLELTSIPNLTTPASGAYIGFTAATGALVENNDILSWSFSQFPLSPITIPQPLQTTQTQFNYTPTLNAGVDYSQSGVPSTSFTGVTMQGTSQAIKDTDFANLVQNTPFQGSTCIHQDLGSGTFSCVVTTDLCTTSTNGTPAGLNCPGAQSASIGTSNTFNADPTQKPYVSPAYIMGKDNALTACGPTDNNTCKGLQNIFVSITGDPALVGRTKDFNSLFIPIEGIVAPTTTASTAPSLNQGWTNGNVSVLFNSTEIVPSNNLNPPATLPTITGINYTISGANAPTPIVGSVTGPSGSAPVPGTVEGITTVTFQAVDNAGTNETIVTTDNSGQATTSLPTLTIKVDRTNPTFICTPPSPVWQATDVSVPCTASDNAGGSGLATPSAFNATTMVAALTETNMAQTLPVNVKDIAGNTVIAGPFGPFLVDKKAPVIAPPSLSTPPVFGQPDTINFSCGDGGSGVVSCGVTGSPTFSPVPNTGNLSVNADTSSAGMKTLTLNAKDLVGNQSTPLAFNYTVAKATPVITWPAPAPIAYGTPLSATQLDATAAVGGNPVPGMFAYNPPAGTVLAPGVQTLNVTFNPTDANDYATVSASVMITVNQPTLNFSPSSINFGNVYLGFPVFGAVVVSNPGTAAVQISSIKVVRGTSDGNDYSIVSNCPKSLKAGGVCVIGVGFYADDLGLQTASIVLTDTAAGSPQQIPLSANVIKKKH